MTITTEPRSDSLAPSAIAAGAAGLLCALVGTYLDTPYHLMGAKRWGLNFTNRTAGELVILIGFAVVGTAAVFGVVVRAGLRREPQRIAVYSLVLALIGAASLLAFWSGLPAILAVGSAVMALSARRRLGRLPAPAALALVAAALTVVAAIGLAFTG